MPCKRSEKGIVVSVGVFVPGAPSKKGVVVSDGVLIPGRPSEKRVGISGYSDITGQIAIKGVCCTLLFLAGLLSHHTLREC